MLCEGVEESVEAAQGEVGAIERGVQELKNPFDWKWAWHHKRKTSKQRE